MRIFLLIALIIFLFSEPVMANDSAESNVFLPPGTDYENKAAIINRQLKEESFEKNNKIEVNTVYMTLVHYHYMEPDQFGILMKVPNSETGCFDITPIEYEASFIDNNYMDIKIKDYRRTKVKTQNVAYDCDQKSKAITGLVVISASDLQKRGIRQIRFSNGEFRDHYDVTVLPDSIRLKPQSMIGFKAVNLVGPDKDYMVHYFSDKALVAVHVPMAEDHEDIAQKVRNLAYRSALQPVFEQEGLDTSGEGNIFYFKDPTGRALDRLNDEGYAELGSIQVIRPYVGANGKNGIPVALKVFLTRPGTTL